MAAVPPPYYPDDKQWSNGRDVVFVMPPGAAPAAAGAAPAPATAPPANTNMDVVKKEMNALTRVCESLMEYIRSQVETTFNNEYPGKERWHDFIGTVRQQVSDLEEASKRYALYLNMADINVIEGEKIKIPTVLLLDLIKRTIELIETSKVVEKNGLKTGLFKKSDKNYLLTDDPRIKTAVANIRSQVRVDKLDLNQFKVDIDGQLGGVVRINGFTEREIVNASK